MFRVKTDQTKTNIWNLCSSFLKTFLIKLIFREWVSSPYISKKYSYLRDSKKTEILKLIFFLIFIVYFAYCAVTEDFVKLFRDEVTSSYLVLKSIIKVYVHLF